MISVKNPSCMEEIEFQNDKLKKAIELLNDRERFVLFSRTLVEHSFDEIAQDLNLSYKGVAAIYYRAIQKIKKNMEEENEFQ